MEGGLAGWWGTGGGDDPLVRSDNGFAVMWTPFDFLVAGKVDHCGTDLFDLVRVDGKWMIAGIADTGRKVCGK